jgi:hypothetical protein
MQFFDRGVQVNRKNYLLLIALIFVLLAAAGALAAEIFIKFGEDNISVNRVYSGFSFKISENLKGGVFYLWQKSKISGGWRNANIIGTSLKLYF